MVMKAGILGYNEGNGHPFSFSAIVNGYEPEAFVTAGWQVILNYLEKQPQEAFDFKDVQFTHAWTQDMALTRQLCAASRIPNAVEHYEAMLGEVDVVVIARDDAETHLPLAKPFLMHGTPVFVDKPLTLDMSELAWFEPYLHRGLLMSTSGMRYAKELDPLRANLSSLGDLRFIEGAVLNQLDKYGIHLLDALNGLGFQAPRSIMRLPSPHASYALMFDDNVQFNLNCLGAVGKTFHLSFYGTKAHVHFDLHDNFSAFKRTLQQVFTMAREKRPVINPAETIATMQLIFKARTLKPMEKISLIESQQGENACLI